MTTTSQTTTSDPLIAWQRLRSGNAQAFEAVPGNPSPESLRSCPPDRPVAAIFRCADTTLASETVFGQNHGSLIDISNWGHVVDNGALASLEYAVETLGVPLIVVLGHHDCQAMRTAMRAWTDAVMPGGASRTVVEHTIGSIVRRGAAAESIEEVTAAHIVETGLALLERSPIIARRVNEGRCAIVCASTGSTDGRIVVHATVGSVGEVDGALLECV
jgi:carbonic anhydrase